MIASVTLDDSDRLVLQAPGVEGRLFPRLVDGSRRHPPQASDRLGSWSEGSCLEETCNFDSLNDLNAVAVPSERLGSMVDSHNASGVSVEE